MRSASNGFSMWCKIFDTERYSCPDGEKYLCAASSKRKNSGSNDICACNKT